MSDDTIDDNIKSKEDIKDEKRVNDGRARLESELHKDIGYAQDGEKSAPGRLQSSSTTAEAVENGGHDNKYERKRREAELAMTLDEIDRELDKIRAEMNRILEELAASIKREKDLKDALKSGDITAMTVILQEVGKDTDGLTDDEIIDMAKKQVIVEQYTQKNLFRDFKAINNEYQAKIEQNPQLKDDADTLKVFEKRLKDLESKAKENHLDINEAREEYRGEIDYWGESEENETLGENADSGFNTEYDEYDTVATSPNAPSPFAAMASKTSVAKMVDPDEKTNTASITSPFNKVAAVLDIKPKMEDPAPGAAVKPLVPSM
ncbi:hypothetical protein GC194_04825 [bacterium]|nr:hypothetical protein [bacterium]